MVIYRVLSFSFTYLGFSCYFHVFCPLVAVLMDVLFTMPNHCTSKSAVTHQDFIMIFEQALSNLPSEPNVPLPPTKACKTKKHAFTNEGEDGDLMIGSEPIMKI